MHSCPAAIADSGTYYSNAIKCGNTNALMNVCDNYEKVKEFFNVENEALIVSAFLRQERFVDKDDAAIASFVPENIKRNIKSQRRWFFGKIRKLLKNTVLSEIEDLPSLGMRKKIFMCRQHGCQTSSTYAEARSLHERSQHDLTVTNAIKVETPSKKDDLYEWSCSHMALGLLLHNADDSIKEGDGDRLARVWNFLTFIFRLTGHTKYALLGLRYKACELALLSPKRYHQLKWNRFVNTKGGRGIMFSRDLRLEHINKVEKQLIKSQGLQNITDENVEQLSKSVRGMENIMQTHLADVGMTKRSTHHSNKHNKEMFESVLKEVHEKARNFEHTPGRSLVAYPDFDKKLFAKIDPDSLFTWIRRHRSKWHNQNLYLYNF